MARSGEKNKSLGRVGIYYRVSTDKQDLTSQEEAIRKYLDELGQDQKPLKSTVYSDEGISGKTTNRPGFLSLLEDARDGKLDTIVVYRLDRLSRHATTAIRILLDLDESGVAFISVSQPVLNLGPQNPFRRTMLAAFAEIAEIERETIVARVRSGLDAAKRRGVKLGPPVKAVDEKKQQALVLRGQGYTVRQIASELELSVGTVHSLLKEKENAKEQI